MKCKRIMALLTALVMLVSLLPVAALPASATGSDYRIVLIGVIEYIYNDIGDDFRLHYWGGGDGQGDLPLEWTDGSVEKSLGASYWNGDPQPFRLYTAKLPADATGFKLWHPGTSRWFGADGDAQTQDRVFLFEYGGSDLALYGAPLTNIGTPEDWSALAEDVELGQDYRGRTVTLANGLEATTPIGREERPFRGCFDGCDNLLTVHFDDRGQEGMAPFRWISDGAVIRNLNVEGSVLGGRHAGGLVGFCQGGDPSEPNLIENCRVAVNVGGSDYNGGIVGHGKNSCLAIQSCIYSGVLSDSNQYCGGLQGWADGNELTVSNCLFCGSYASSGSFDPIAVGYGSHSFTNAYYAADPLYTSADGTPVSLILPEDSLALQGDVLGIQLWVLGQTEVEGFDDWYLYDGTEHSFTPVVRFEGDVLEENVDYVWTIDGQIATGVTEQGCHELTVTGVGAYTGSVTLPIMVIPSALTGAGSQADPFLIINGADWVRFALDVADGHSFSGEYVRLENDIPVYMKAGVVYGGFQDAPFSGTFEGNGQTIHVNITDLNNQGTAPFCYINGATIQNLKVSGSVRGDYHAAGLVGFCLDTNNRIENCVVDTDVYASDYIGGIVGHALDSELFLENCLYTGLLAGGGSAKGALLGWDDPGGTKHLHNCCYVPRGGQSLDALELIHGLSGSVTLDHCYRCTDDCQLGVRVYDYAPADCVFGKIEVAGFPFILPCEISGVPAVFNCANGPVTPAPLVEFDGTTLADGADYALELERLEDAKSDSLSEPGRYALRISGVNSFSGVQIIPFQVSSITWALEEDGSGQYTILHISGEGPMEDLEPYAWDGSGRYDVPETQLGDIRTLVIDVGVTAIGDCAFDGFPNLEKVLIPAGTVRIGKYAFTSSGSGFTELRLPPSLLTIEECAFDGLFYVTDLWCGRDAQAWQDFLNSPEVDLTGNQILTGWNSSWQQVNYHWPVVSNIQTAPTPEGTVRFTVEGVDTAQASDGQLVYVVSEPVDGYELDQLLVSFEEHGVPYTFSVRPLTAFTMAFDSNVTVTPVFRAIVYPISYQGLAGVNPLPQNPSSYTVQTPSFTLINPSKPGYDFLGWTLNGGSSISLTATVPQGTVGPLDFTAHWRANSYQVRFDPNGGTGNMPDQDFSYDTAQALDLNAFSAPTGYRFAAWNTQPDGSGVSYADGQSVMNLTAVNNGLVTLYAQWVPIIYTVRFDPNGGTGSMADQRFTYDLTQNLNPNSFSYGGWNFVGWNTQADGSGVGYADMDPVLNLSAVENDIVTLYAQWTGWSYFIHFEPNHSAAVGNMGDVPFFHSQPQNLPGNAFSVPGYHFLGWSLNQSGTNGIDYTDGDLINLLPAFDGETITLYAQWEPNTYLIHYEPNGGGGSMGDQAFVYDSPGNLDLNAFTRPGYDFIRWNTMPDGSGTSYANGAQVNIPAATDGEIIVLYAQWRGLRYYVYFDPNDPNATGTMANQSLVYDTPQALTANAFSLAGYSFKDWNDDPAGLGNAYQDCEIVNLLPPSGGATFTLYAQWKANHYVIQFDPNAPPVSYTGSMQPQPFDYNVPQNLNPNQFNRPGYTFLGWGTAPAGPVSYADGAPLNIPANDGQIIVLYAQWRANTYIVHFDDNAGTVPGGTTGTMTDQSFTYNQLQNLDPNLFVCNNPYYYFVGWCEDMEGLIPPIYMDREAVMNLTDVDGAVVTLYAIWRPVHFTVVYHGNGAPGPVYTQEIYYDSPENLEPNRFVYPGYGFRNWDTVPSGLYGAPLPDQSPINNNFFVANNINNIAIPLAIDLYAQWGPCHYTVVFDSNGGTGTMANQNFTYGNYQRLTPLGFSRPGYSFGGWLVPYPDGSSRLLGDNDLVNPDLTDIDNDIVVLYAQWNPWHYTIRFNSNPPGNIVPWDGAMLDMYMTYDQGKNLIANAYTCRGYHFSHWNTRADDTGTSYSNTQFVNILPAYDNEIIRLYARWKPNTYTVIFDANGGTGSMPNQMFTYDLYGNLSPNTFTRTGYTFIGWNTKADGTGTPYADGASVVSLTAVNNGTVTLYAQWRANTYTVHFERNGANQGLMQDQSFTYDQAQNLRPNAFVHFTKSFYSWNTQPNGSGTSYQDGQSVMNLTVVDGAVVTLYAQWGPRYWIVSTDVTGGVVVARSRSESFLAGSPITLEAIPDPGNVLYSISAVYYDVENMPVAFPLEKVGEEEDLWSFVMPNGNVLITAVFGPPIHDGFYLIGPDWSLSAIDAANRFAPDPAEEGQYLLQTTLTEGQQIRVVRVESGQITAWYPGESENFYTVDAAHAGDKTICFRDAIFDDWMEFGGYFWIEANPVGPAEPIEISTIRIFPSIGIGIETVASFSVRSTELSSYEFWYIEVSKLDGAGNAVESKRFGDGQEGSVSGSFVYKADYTDITAKELGVPFTASVHAFDANGQEYVSHNVVSNSPVFTVRDYILGELVNEDNADATRKLAADLLNYGAAAQVYFGFDTENLVNANLSAEAQAAMSEFATTGEAPAALVNNANSANIFSSVSVMNRIMLTLSIRGFSSAGAVQIEIKDHDTGAVKEVIDAEKVSTIWRARYSGFEAEDMRTAFDFTVIADGAASGTPITWSVEGYAREARLNEDSSPEELALLNALLHYVDAVAAVDFGN